MTPKQKAEELFSKFTDVDKLGYYFNDGFSSWSTKVLYEQSKQCALIAVDEILNIGYIDVSYWMEVKTEIENYQ